MPFFICKFPKLPVLSWGMGIPIFGNHHVEVWLEPVELREPSLHSLRVRSSAETSRSRKKKQKKRSNRYTDFTHCFFRDADNLQLLLASWAAKLEPRLGFEMVFDDALPGQSLAPD